MRRCVGDDDYDALGFGTKRKARGVRERVELVLGNVAAAAGMKVPTQLMNFCTSEVMMLRYSQLQSGYFGDDVIFERDQAEAVVAIVGGEILGEIDDVLLDRVDIGLHRFGDVEHENDIDRTTLADAAKIEHFGRLAVLEYLDVVLGEIADGLAALVGQAEVELTPPSVSKWVNPGLPVVT